MQERLAGYYERTLGRLISRYITFTPEQVDMYRQRFWVGLAATFFVVISTIVVAFDDVFLGFNQIATLQIGDVAPQTIVAPGSAVPFVSEILTEEARQQARDNVLPRFDPPDADVSRQQTQLAQQIIEYINNVRRDPYGTREQKIEDINFITTLTLEDRISESILRFNDDSWSEIENEIETVLARVMRESIQLDTLQGFREQLTNQISVRFNPQERDVIVAVLEDLLRANTFENPEATETARNEVASAIDPIERSFIRGESIVNEGDIISPADYEALQELGLLQSEDRRFQDISRALVASVLVLVIMGLYMLRFEPSLILEDTHMLALIATIFIIALIGARFIGVNGSVYIYPISAVALLFTPIVGAPIAIIASLGLGLLTGLMDNNSLEIMTLVSFGGIVGALSLRRVDRINTFFVAGAMIGIINAAVISVFYLSSANLAENTSQVIEIALSFISGAVLAPALAFAALYIVTQLFNLPTVIKLLDLSQPSKPLLQRLLREAPGTYQHSLQVANLAEQAAHAIGANAQLTHVAALYHDIGKMSNPVYFTENQQDIGNPHDTLNDPYRSAAIIIGHATEGDEMAKQYRLPKRIRDFIREHHGTTQVFVFYKQAINRADGNENAVDIEEFTYPGPRPQSRETAILMLADSCEAAVRSVKPNSKQAIEDLVSTIFDQKRSHGQLDDSNLTLNELYTIKTTFIDILQSIYHPRINYQEAINKRPTNKNKSKQVQKQTVELPSSTSISATKEPEDITNQTISTNQPPIKSNGTQEIPLAPTQNVTVDRSKNTSENKVILDLDEAPMDEVPRLPRMDKKTSQTALNDNNSSRNDVKADVSSEDA